MRPSSSLQSCLQFPSSPSCFNCAFNHTDIRVEACKQKALCQYTHTNPRIPDCNHRLAHREAPWIYAHDTNGAQKLGRTGPQPLQTSEGEEEEEEEEAHEELCVTKEEEKTPTGLQYIAQEHWEEGLIRSNGNHPEVHERPDTIVAQLKACANHKDLEKGSRIHAEIVGTGLLEHDVFVGSTLVSMYARCGSIAKAQEVFDELPVRNVVTWSALIAGYAQHGHGKEALSCFDQMQGEGLSPNAVTFVCILKACGSAGAAGKGQEIHADIVKEGLVEEDVFIGNALVDMYSKCGLLLKAQQVFDRLLVRDVVSWSALIAGYAQLGHGEEALLCFDQMQLEGLSPNTITLVCVLKACGHLGATDRGRQIHAEIIRRGLLVKDVKVGNALVHMYAKCGVLSKAQEACDSLPVRDVVSWGALLAGYCQHGHDEEALSCFNQMQLEGLTPDLITLVCILKTYGNVEAAVEGQEIHARIIREGWLETDVAVGNALVDMYIKCGLLAKAIQLFVKLPVRDVGLWSTLIAGYARYGQGEDALNCFEWMQEEGIPPDAITFICILKACGSIGALRNGQFIHAALIREGLLENCPFVGTALVDMYARCGLLAKAREVFCSLSEQNTVSWSALIAGYSQCHGDEALICFEEMEQEGVSPNAMIFACLLKACGSIGAAARGQELHVKIVKEGLLDKDIFLGNSLVDMYAKCSLLVKVQELFDKLPGWNVVSWNVLIAGYAQHGHGEEALNCFEQMLSEGFHPNTNTFGCILKACACIGAAGKGKAIHTEIEQKGLWKKDLILGNTLVDMYAKCGLPAKAQEVFDSLPCRDVILWNALSTGYALLGKAENVLYAFGKMIGEGVKPDLATFTTVLNVYSHTGLLDMGELYFETMCTDNAFIPTLEHHICMIDLFGRAGHLDKAVALIKYMPFSANRTVWHSLLGACQKWGMMKLGKLAFDHAVQLDQKDDIAYVYLSNICMDTGK